MTSPSEIRDAQFRCLDPKTLTGLRRRCYYELLWHGPATTRDLAGRLGADILSVRPRVTELYQAGLVTLDDERPASNSQTLTPSNSRTPHEGVYRAVAPAPPTPSHADSQLQLV